jgi:hypothetical protein
MQTRPLCILAVLSLLTACSTSSGQGSAPPAGRPEVAVGASTRVSATVSAGPVSVTLTAEQTAAVRAWYGQSAAGNGRGRSGGLPPGIARNLERGKALPPGIAKQTLPQQLLVQLPAPGTGFEYIVAAGKLLLVEAATQIVRQVLLETIFA